MGLKTFIVEAEVTSTAYYVVKAESREEAVSSVNADLAGQPFQDVEKTIEVTDVIPWPRV